MNLAKRYFAFFLSWVSAHEGIKYNEAAHKTAKQVYNSLNSTTPYSDLKLAVTLFIRNKRQRKCDGLSQIKLKEIKPCVAVWFTINFRITGKILTRLRIGHSRLTHRHFLLVEEEPTCPQCHISVLTIRHLLMTVSAWAIYADITFNPYHPIWQTLLFQTLIMNSWTF